MQLFFRLRHASVNSISCDLRKGGGRDSNTAAYIWDTAADTEADTRADTQADISAAEADADIEASAATDASWASTGSSWEEEFGVHSKTFVSISWPILHLQQNIT